LITVTRKMAERLSLPKRVLSVALLGLEALLIAGIVGAVFGWWPSAVLLLLAVVAFVGFHLASAAWIYRRTMARPWPKVPPLEDDEWWD
jgi:ABC-type transport system involved in Fe-S cluster assembly fused permease/ATPase subunit